MGTRFLCNKLIEVLAFRRVALLALLALHFLAGNAYSASEQEPNDSISSAQAISLNESVTGVVNTSEDEDIYAVYLSGPGRLTLEMRSAEYDAGGWIYEIYNPQVEFLRGDYCRAFECKNVGFAASTGISVAGTHYVRIRSALQSKAPAGEYTIKVHFRDDTSGIEF